MQRKPLPPHLGQAFHVRDAQISGVSRSRLRASDLTRPFRGVYSRVGHLQIPADDPARREKQIRARAQLASLQLAPGGFFSHVTSAVIWGIPLPRSVLDDRLDVGVFHPARPPRAKGIRGHRVQVRHATTERHPGTGLPVASPASTWAMLGSCLHDPYDLVAAAEAVISERRFGAPRALASYEHLEAVVTAGRRVGIVALRAALERVRPRVASRTETWTRLTLMIDHGLPEPEINHSVFSETGAFVACVDLAYPEERVAIEYEGEQHLFDPHQWSLDIERYERLAEAGWRVIRVTKAELFTHPARLAARVRRALLTRD